MAPVSTIPTGSDILVSIIVVSYNTKDLLDACLKSVQENILQPYELIVVDNKSTDGSVLMVKQKYPDVMMIAAEKNLGYSAAVNWGVSISRGKYLLILNSDAELTCDAAGRLISILLANPKAGVCGPRLLNADGSIQRSIAKYPTWYGLLGKYLSGLQSSPKLTPSVICHPDKTTCVSGWLTGACVLTTREMWRKTGGLDENFFFMLEDVDWNLRLSQAGYETWYAPDVKVLHRLGSSRRNDSKELEVLLKKSNVKQTIYYAQKNFSPAKVWLMRTFLVLMLGTNLLIRVATCALGRTQIRLHCRHKRRIAMEMLKASFS
jgi:GT2 family glycosyltransferase